MPLQTIVYCSVAELQRFMSSDATDDFADHNSDGDADADVIEDCINQATDEIDMYARQQHTQAQLATSTLITRWCVVMSARFLQERRMNTVSDSVAVQWDRIIENLEKVANNRLQLPGLAKRDDLRPTWSNLKIDRRFRHSKIRVTQTNSSNAPTKLTQDATLPEASGRFD
jgi:phage gp36-like protein